MRAGRKPFCRPLRTSPGEREVPKGQRAVGWSQGATAGTGLWAHRPLDPRKVEGSAWRSLVMLSMLPSVPSIAQLVERGTVVDLHVNASIAPFLFFFIILFYLEFNLLNHHLKSSWEVGGRHWVTDTRELGFIWNPSTRDQS